MTKVKETAIQSDMPMFNTPEQAGAETPAAEIPATPAPNATALEVIDTETGEIKTVENITAMPSIFEPNNFAKILEASRGLAEKKNVVSVTPSYMEFTTEGAEVRGIFCGFAMISKKALDGTLTPIKCATWMDNGKMFMAGGVALVSEFEQRNINEGTAVQIKYTGKRGNTKLFDLAIIY